MPPSYQALLFATLVAGCQTAGPVAQGAEPCQATDATRAELRRTIEGFYDALARDDARAYASVTTPDFAAYEIGKRYSGAELFAVIEQAHRDGRQYVWNVGAIEVRSDCRLATAVWQTTGSSGTPPKIEPRAWLESAIFVWQDGRWLMAFLHSTPKDPRP